MDDGELGESDPSLGCFSGLLCVQVLLCWRSCRCFWASGFLLSDALVHLLLERLLEAGLQGGSDSMEAHCPLLWLAGWFG